MPRPLDTTLEKRVLDAARRLWRTGEQNLTIRALASAANTHTPGIYSRFRSRRNIIKMLLAQFDEELSNAVRTSESVESVTELYLDFAISHAHEYKTLFVHRHDFTGTRTKRSADGLGPTFDWLREKLADRFNEPPEENGSLALAIWSLWHGTAALLIVKAGSPHLADALRTACRSGVNVLIQDACRRRTRVGDRLEHAGPAGCHVSQRNEMDLSSGRRDLSTCNGCPNKFPVIQDGELA